MANHCKDCPIVPWGIMSKTAERIHDYGCLADFHLAKKWYAETGKVWACHDKNTTPCIGFINRMKDEGFPPVKVEEGLITEHMTIEEIYHKSLYTEENEY